MAATFKTARHILATLLDMGAEELEPDVTLHFHNVSPVQALTMVKAFPELEWDANRQGSSEWLTGTRNRVDITMFLETPPREEPSIAKDVLKEVARG